MTEKFEFFVNCETRNIMEQVEAQTILRVLQMNNGNRRKTCEMLGIAKRTLRYKVADIPMLREYKFIGHPKKIYDKEKLLDDFRQGFTLIKIGELHNLSSSKVSDVLAEEYGYRKYKELAIEYKYLAKKLESEISQ